MSADETDEVEPAAHCKLHPNKQAARLCERCDTALCENCVEEKVYRDKHDMVERTYFVCSECGARALEHPGLDSKEIALPVSSFIYEALYYPIASQGLSIILGGISLFFGWGLLLVLSILNFWIIGIAAGLLLTVELTGYVLNYYVAVLRSAAFGQENPPSWPEVIGPWTTFLKPVVHVFGTAVICFFPVIPLLVFPFRPNFLWWFLLVLFLAAGGVYYPMALLIVTILKSPAGLHPGLVFRSITEASRYYRIVVGSFLVVAASFLAMALIVFYVPVPLLIMLLVFSFFFHYSFLVISRMLGRIYDLYEDRFDWFAIVVNTRGS